MSRAIHIAWLYPDILNIHGGRGDIMALNRIGAMMGLDIEIRRCESLKEEVPFEWADIIYMTSGEIKCMPEIVKALDSQRAGLDEFIAKGGSLWAVGSSGAVLGDKLELANGNEIPGLGLLGMAWKERASVWGDDLWFATDFGFEVMGNQIQVADVVLAEDQEPFGKVIYGRGNCGDGSEGAKTGNVLFTNCLGPMLVKNPRLTATLLKTAADKAGIEEVKILTDEDMVIEDKSFELIKKFIGKKQA
ncbi:MAG: hypothetical protein Q4B18_05180 [Bacillota bacterium]|nr:hypothetical protein [Bacillota bacterium]